MPVDTSGDVNIVALKSHCCAEITVTGNRTAEPLRSVPPLKPDRELRKCRKVWLPKYSPTNNQTTACLPIDRNAAARQGSRWATGAGLTAKHDGCKQPFVCHVGV